VTARARYVMLSAARTRTPLAPLAISLFAVIGIYAYRQNEVGATFGLTAVICCALAAWLVGAVLTGEPGAQADMAVVALGGRRGRLTVDIAAILVAALFLTVLFIAYPLATDPLGSTPMFKPDPLPGDIASAALAHLACSILGGAIGVLFAPPRLQRPATSVAATGIALIALAASKVGPIAVARGLNDAPRGTITGAEIVGEITCLALAAVVLAAGVRWARR
jgi:hypothetical protein